MIPGRCRRLNIIYETHVVCYLKAHKFKCQDTQLIHDESPLI